MEIKNLKKIIISLIGLLLVVMVGASYVAFKYSAKVVYTTPIDSIVKSINNNLVAVTSNTASTNMKISARDKNNDFIINNLELNLVNEIDIDNKTLNFEMNSKYSNVDLLKINSYFENNKGYLYVKNAYDKYINFDIDEEQYNSIFEPLKNINEYQIVSNEIGNALKKSLLNEYFSVNDTEISINDKKVNVTKNTLNLSEFIFNKISIDFLTEINSNKEFLRSFSKILTIPEAELIKNIESSLNNLKNEKNLSTETKTIINIYTKGILKDFVKLDVNLVNNGNLEIVKNSENNYTFMIKDSSSTEIIGGTIENNNYIYNINVENKELGSVNFSFSRSITYNSNIEKPNISNSISYEEINSEELESIRIKLMENEGIKKLVNDISKLPFLENNNSNPFISVNKAVSPIEIE